MNIMGVIRGDALLYEKLQKSHYTYVALLSYIGVYFASMAIAKDDLFVKQYILVGIFEASKALIYAVLCFRALYFYRKEKVVGWLLIGGGLFAWVPAQTYLAIRTFTDKNSLLSATIVGDTLIMIVFLFAAFGLAAVGYHGLSLRQKIRITINALSFGACITFIGVVYLSSYIMDKTEFTSSEKMVNIIYFAIDVMFIAFSLSTMLYRRFDKIYCALGGSTLFLAFSDIAYTVAFFQHRSIVAITRSIQIGAIALWFYASIQKKGSPVKVPTVRGENYLTLGVNATVLSSIIFAVIAVPQFDPIPGAILVSFVAMFVIVLAAHMVGYFENKNLQFAQEKAIERISQSEEKYQELATHDPLTGLSNRTWFIEHLKKALIESQVKSQRVAVLFIDLDRFKDINDTYGHNVGDDVIRILAQRIETVVGKRGLVSRLGGDEFSVLIPPHASHQRTHEIADQILEAAINPFDIAGSESYLSCSIGIAYSDDSDSDPQSLLRNADAAMYRAKELGRNRIETTAEIERSLRSTHGWTLSDLHHAIVNDEIQVFYQPIHRLETNEISGYEALARWSHPTLGTVTPDEFIPVAEDNGLIIELGNIVMKQAFSQMSKWKEHYPNALTMSINLSFRQLNDPHLLETILEYCDIFDVTPTSVVFEMTESSLLGDVRSAISTLKEIQAHGFHLSIDDFGTGYSSLSYLKKFPVSGFKIDKSYIQGYLSNEDDQAIVKALVALGSSLGLVVTAEGIEDLETRDALIELGCVFGQGYLYSPPVRADEITLPSTEPGKRPLKSA